MQRIKISIDVNISIIVRFVRDSLIQSALNMKFLYNRVFCKNYHLTKNSGIIFRNDKRTQLFLRYLFRICLIVEILQRRQSKIYSSLLQNDQVVRMSNLFSLLRKNYIFVKKIRSEINFQYAMEKSTLYTTKSQFNLLPHFFSMRKN